MTSLYPTQPDGIDQAQCPLLICTWFCLTNLTNEHQQKLLELKERIEMQ
jgi:hypothetical protein